MDHNEPIIRTVGVKRIFGKGSAAVHALKGANLSVPSGRLVALKGRSGSGKTTLNQYARRIRSTNRRCHLLHGSRD